MNREILHFESEAAWLDLRKQDITSTEVSALFGCSPYNTTYGLYHQKSGLLEPEFESNDRMKWGNRLESAIAYGIAEDLGLEIEPFKVYARIPDIRAGSSFDFKIIGLADGYKGDEFYRDMFRDNGPGIMEVKNVDGLQFRRSWIAEEEIMEAPPHIEMQVQHQQLVTDMEWTVIAPLVGGNTPMPFARIRDRAIGDVIVEKVQEFWQQVKEGKAPPPDYQADGDVIARLLYQDNGETVDMRDNASLAELVARHTLAIEAEKSGKDLKDSLKAEILMTIGHNAKVLLNGGYINAGTNKGSAGTIVTADMIGTRVGQRSGYRMMRFYPSTGRK